MTDPADMDGAPSPARRRWRRRPLWHFFGLPAGRRLLLAEAVARLALSRVALLVFPFRVVAARFGTVSPPGQGDDARDLNEVQSAQAREVGWAVTRAARYVPFRAVCLPQAIAAQAMLRRRRVASVMHFGVAKTAQQPLSAHAWLDAGQVQVTGYPVGADIVEIARFV